LLLDEPLAALDRKLREHTQFELLNIQKALGVTFIVVTHDQEEAMTLSSRMGVMNHGRIVQVGSPTQIYEFPATRFVADFIGSVNLFEGRIAGADAQVTRAGGSRTRIHSNELGCALEVEQPQSLAAGATVWAAIRPEKIAIAREAPTPPDAGGSQEANVVRGSVKDVAYLGDMSVYLVQIESGKLVRVTRPNVMRGTQDRIAASETVYLSWHASSPVVLTE